MGTKEVLYSKRTMDWGCDTALYRTKRRCAANCRRGSPLAACDPRNRAMAAKGLEGRDIRRHDRQAEAFVRAGRLQGRAEALTLKRSVERLRRVSSKMASVMTDVPGTFSEGSCAATWRGLAVPAWQSAEGQGAGEHRPRARGRAPGPIPPMPIRDSSACAG